MDRRQLPKSPAGTGILVNFANIYRGEKLGDLDEHQHLEAYIGYVVRLAVALRL
jgi:hypothetical protein